MGKRALRKSDIKELNNKAEYLKISKKEKVEVDGNIILINGKPSLFYYEERVAPHLKLLLEQDVLKSAIVDMPAVKFLVNGADVMRPGIVKIDPAIEKDDLVSVKDETHGKTICVCIALFSGEEMERMDSGKVLKNIHHIGDNIWQYN